MTLCIEETPRQLHLDNVIGEWHRVLTRLQRKARSQRGKLHIVVDGLYQIPKEDEKYVQDVVKDVLSLGNPVVRHILTWTETSDAPKFLTKLKVRKVPIPPLSESESRLLLETSGIDKDSIKEILEATQGVPALLASTIRLNNLGKLDKAHLHNDLSDYYEIEWSAFKDRHLGIGDCIVSDLLSTFLTTSTTPVCEVDQFTG